MMIEVMKKNLSLLCATALMAALALSCAKETPAREDSLTPDVPEAPEVSGTVFSANYASLSVKTTISDGEGADKIVSWAAGDRIKIFWTDAQSEDQSDEPQAASAGTSTTFEANVTAADDYYAVYPAGAGAYAAGTVSVIVPAAQDGTFASANIAAAATTVRDMNFSFKNATTLFKFSVSGADYTKAVFTGAMGEAVAGTAAISSFDSEGKLVLDAATETSAKIEVALNGAGTYYFSVLPGTFASGYGLTLYKGDIADEPAIITSSKTLEASTLIDMGEVDAVAEVKDFFVTPAGSGKKTGKSWDNAMGTAELRAFLEQPVDGEGNQIDDAAHYKARVLDGATIYMAAGDYYLAEGVADGQVKVEFTKYEKPVSISFKGGYPDNLSGKSLAGRTEPAATEAEPDNCTAFTGNLETGIFLFGNQTDASFEGISFKNANFTANHGALEVAAGATGDATLTISQCRFVGNKNDDSHSGAGLLLNKASASVSDCYFGANEARNAAAIFLNTGEGSVSITDCLFKGNATANTSGALQNAGPKTVTVQNCTFENNTAGSYGGGAFHANGTDVSTDFIACVFTGNSCPQGGAISIQNASATFTDCEFTDNTASKGDRTKGSNTNENTAVSAMAAGGAIILHSASSVCTLNNCRFSGNQATNGCGGAIAFENASARLTVNAGTSFAGNTAYYHGAAIFGLGSFTIAGESGNEVTFAGDHTLAPENQYANGGAVWAGPSTASAISYAVFDGCEAGQESGSTVNYSNGGAISVKEVASFSAENCEFKACRARNGGALNIEPKSASAITITACNFHDNILKSGADKTGTSGNFHGGACRMGGSGTAAFVGCTFKDNTAYHGSGAFHINTDAASAMLTDCTFEGNYCQNGNGGAITLEKGALQLSDCLFKGNYVVSGSTVRNGGVFYVDTNAESLTAENCVFRENYIDGSGNAFGAVMRVQGDADVSYTGCVFEGNHSVYRGGVFALNASTRLKISDCLVKNNYAAGGGMIQCGANCIVYMNRVAFTGNYTTSSGGWGVNVHSGNANICMNNVTSYNNYNTHANPGNCIAFNSDGGWLITNSTILDKAPSAVIRANGTRKVTLCNNILSNENTADNMFMLKSTGIYNDKGHNVFSFTTAPSSPTLASTDVIGQSHSTLGGSWQEVWDETAKYAVYAWNNGLSFTAATEAEVTDAMKTAYPENDTVHTSITNIGLDFYNWLDGMSPKGYQVDGRGVTRGTSWWPGSYQAE